MLVILVLIDSLYSDNQSVATEVSDQSAQKVETSVALSISSEGKSTCVTLVHKHNMII